MISLDKVTKELQTGKRPKGGAIDSGIPSLGAEHLDKNGGFNFSKLKYVDEGFYNNMRSGLIREDDIIIVKDGATTGKVSFVDDKFPLHRACINEHVFILRLNESVYPKYIFYHLFSKIGQRQILEDYRGSTVGGISKKFVNFIKIPFPPLETQKHIAQILDDAAALRDKTKQLIMEYDQLAQSIFLDMFGDPVVNPRGWQVKKLKSITSKILSGNTPKGGSNVYVEKGITFFRSQNVWRNRLELDNVAYIDEITHKKMNKSSLCKGDILMTKTGRINTENSSLGRAAMFNGENDSANINGHVYLIRPKEDVINEFVLFILTTNEYRGYIRRVCVGGIDKRQINKEHLEEFPIIYPPIKLQNQFAEKITLIEQQKTLAQQELKEAEDLFNCLLQKAFKGELVKELV
ncbi:type I restriction enzyme, S subunit [Sinomicrobium oceani]|uniref:Type I restriction enzyme, S subunit n=1 Tax=Sinomicrobium oceani TaxID=1150368 RepID=A0A1K1N8A5_9FLAO|nr:restriction endonuclease subunit S [Sinomicrobium oceani]SFW31469.1 type I restriction enzyme, S subunit [Sinomicrobium oceani]